MNAIEEVLSHVEVRAPITLEDVIAIRDAVMALSPDGTRIEAYHTHDTLYVITVYNGAKTMKIVPVIKETA